jgi:hypothetical protein
VRNLGKETLTWGEPRPELKYSKGLFRMQGGDSVSPAASSPTSPDSCTQKNSPPCEGRYSWSQGQHRTADTAGFSAFQPKTAGAWACPRLAVARLLELLPNS